MYCNNCWSFKHACNKYRVQELTIFYPAHFNLRYLFTMNLMPYPLTNFGQNCDSATLSQFLWEHPQEILGEVLLPSPCPASLSPGLHLCPYSPTTPTPTLSTPLQTQPLQPLSCLLPLWLKQLLGPLKNSSCWPPPPKRVGEVTNPAAGQAAVDWTMLELALVWLDTLFSNTALLAVQNCSSKSSRKTYPERISTFQYVPVCTVQQILVLPCTSMYHIQLLVLSCTTLYSDQIVPACTTL